MILQNCIYEKWQDRWNEEKTCRQTKQFFKDIEINKSKKILKLARSQLTRLVKITTGHNSLAYHAYKIDNTIDPTCRLCEEAIETFYHFATECPRLHNLRREIFKGEPIDETWAIGRLLELSNVPAIDALLTWE